MQGSPGARTAMQYAIDLVNVPSILQAHIHQGPQGASLALTHVRRRAGHAAPLL